MEYSFHNYVFISVYCNYYTNGCVLALETGQKDRETVKERERERETTCRQIITLLSSILASHWTLINFQLSTGASSPQRTLLIQMNATHGSSSAGRCPLSCLHTPSSFWPLSTKQPQIFSRVIPALSFGDVTNCILYGRLTHAFGHQIHTFFFSRPATMPVSPKDKALFM